MRSCAARTTSLAYVVIRQTECPKHVRTFHGETGYLQGLHVFRQKVHRIPDL